MDKNLKLMMWSSSNLDLQNVDDDHLKITQKKAHFEPTTYTFAKLENGKKSSTDSTSFTPPSWLLLDHSIAVIWSMFNASPQLHELTIDDYKWAYEFLRGIKNKKGENPPDVKVCLKEIQDQLINLYARLTSLKENFDEIAAAFREEIIENTTTTTVYNSTFTKTKTKTEAKSDSLTFSRPGTPRSPPAYRRSLKDITENSKGEISVSKTKFPVLEEDSDYEEESETQDSEEVEKYFLSLFEDDSKGDFLQTKPSVKSLIPTKKKISEASPAEVEVSEEVPRLQKEKTKRVHCVAEMRSLKFHKSMKVQDTNGEEAAYSNLKAEIKKLSFNPNVPRTEILKFLKDWRSEQVNRLNNELKRLSSIEEFMKSFNREDVEPKLQMDSRHDLKELHTTKSNYSYRKNLLH